MGGVIGSSVTEMENDSRIQLKLLRESVLRLIDEKAELQRENERLRNQVLRQNEPDSYDEVHGG